MNDTAGAVDGMQRESLNSPTQALHFHSRSRMLLHTAGTCFDPTIYIAELNLGKFPLEFQSWKTNFRAEVCLKTADPHHALGQRS